MGDAMNNGIPFFNPFQGFPQPNFNQNNQIDNFERLESKIERLEKNIRILENRINNLEKNNHYSKDYYQEEKNDMYML